jgi:hypothetical protein
LAARGPWLAPVCGGFFLVPRVNAVALKLSVDAPQGGVLFALALLRAEESR